jgi:predicted aspartyl protease
MANVRDAIGFESLKACTTGIRVEGTLTSGFLNRDDKVRYRLHFTPDGRYREVVEDPRGGESGYDGKRQWFMDFSEVPWYVDDSPQLLSRWVITGAWLAELQDVSLAVVDDQVPEDRIVLSIRINKQDTARWLVIDRQTWLPERICKPHQVESPEWEFEFNRPTMGFRLPSRIISHPRVGLSQAVDTITIDRINKLDRPCRDAGAMPAPSRRAVFMPAAPAEVECRFARDGKHVLVKASIGNMTPRWFVLDSGTSYIAIDYDIAEELHLDTVSEFEGTMTGQRTNMRLASSKTFRIGPLTLSKAVFMALPTSQITQYIDDDITGIIGFDVFRQAVVEMDAAIPSVRLVDPNLYNGKDLDWTPFRYSRSKLIHVRCRLEGDNEAYIMIDTGFNGGLNFREEAFQALGLTSHAKATPGHLDFGGLRVSHSAKTRLAWFEIGGHRLSDLDVGLSRSQEQYIGVNNAAIVGLEILSQFRVVFDYPHMRIAFFRKKAEQSTQTETSTAPQGPTHVNAVLQQWSAGQQEDAVRAFLRLAEMQPADAGYRLFDCSEQQFVSLPEAERDQLREKMLARIKVARAFARELDRRAKEALAANDYPTAERLLAGLKRWGAANTGPEVARLTDLVGKALEKLADDGLAKLDAARASPERQ